MAKESLVSKNELRVGNLVLCKDKVTEVESIYEQGINLYISGDYYGAWKCDYDGYFTYDWFAGALIDPIPLTEEWLLKLGFRVGGEQGFFNDSDYEIVVDEKGFTIVHDSVDMDLFFICVEYVHQLQNAFFALTGNELTLTPAKEEMK